jgi:hypothetical protein
VDDGAILGEGVAVGATVRMAVGATGALGEGVGVCDADRVKVSVGLGSSAPGVLVASISPGVSVGATESVADGAGVGVTLTSGAAVADGDCVGGQG